MLRRPAARSVVGRREVGSVCAGVYPRSPAFEGRIAGRLEKVALESPRVNEASANANARHLD